MTRSRGTYDDTPSAVPLPRFLAAAANGPVRLLGGHLINIGIGGSLDQALQMATSGILCWLERDYKLAASDAAIVAGFAVRYDIVDLVGTQVSVAAKLPKAELAKLRKAS